MTKLFRLIKAKSWLPKKRKFSPISTAAWSEMQRGYKEIMKVADDGKKDEVARLLADGSYFIIARNNTLAAVRNLNDYNTSRNEAAIKANATGIGGWSGILWLLLAAGGYSFNSHGDNYNRIDHQTAEEGCADDAGSGKRSSLQPVAF